MARFFCSRLPPPWPDDSNSPRPLISLSQEQAHHARKVLRLNVGQEVEVFDGQGRVGQARIMDWHQGGVLELVRVRQIEPTRPGIDLATAIPKGPRAEDMIESLSQLGVSRLRPLLCARSVVDPRPGKIERFGRTAVESAKQCQRAYIMEIDAPLTLAALLVEEYPLRLLASPAGQPSLELGSMLAKVDKALILIGPEGGWTAEELVQAREAGCIEWSLGPHILRIETAAAAAVAIARHLAMAAERLTRAD